MDTVLCFIFVIVAWIGGLLTKSLIDRMNPSGTIKSVYANQQELLYIEFDDEAQMNELRNKKVAYMRVDISRKK